MLPMLMGSVPVSLRVINLLSWWICLDNMRLESQDFVRKYCLHCAKDGAKKIKMVLTNVRVDEAISC